MYNFHKVRALELNTDIGYIPEKSNKKAKLGMELKIFLPKNPSWKVIHHEDSQTSYGGLAINLAPPTI